MSQVTLKVGDIRQKGTVLLMHWQRGTEDIVLCSTAMYRLIGLKKILETKLQNIDEAFISVGESHGGQLGQDGRMDIPEENIEAVNEELTKLANETETIEFNPIKLGPADVLPMDLMEALYDFIEIQE